MPPASGGISPTELSVRFNDHPGESGTRHRRVLVVQHASDLSGSTISGQLVVGGLMQAGWEVEAVLASEGPGRTLYEELGCAVHLLPHKNWLRGGNFVQSMRRTVAELRTSTRFVELVRRTRPDLIYINSLVSLAAAVAARRLRIPCVWHIRELFDDVDGEMKIPPIVGRGFVRRMIAGCADHTVLISDAVRRNILGEHWKGETSIVPNAADERFFHLMKTQSECRALFGLPMEGSLVGVPGTLRPMKGHEFFLDAAAAAIARGTACCFAVTGDGEPKYVEMLKQRVASLGLQQSVWFLGSITQMPEFYRACDVVCIPSRAEPFGRTVIEAFAVGVPVAASAVGGMRETITHGENGLLVDYGNVPGMAAALRQLLADKPLRERLTSAARDAAETCYSAAAYQKRIHQIVAATIASRQVRP